ncbi:MAG: hypothetical protein J6Z49_12180 [Kiritimatiellae bacterium]|nr:hypothetical protein [Kiritimatiellia bacterium]
MKKLILVCIALASVIPASFSFGASDGAKQRAAVKEAVESVCKQADAVIKDAKVLNKDMPIYLWVRGGKDNQEAVIICERLLQQSLVDSGKTSVVSDDDEKDQNFKRFLDQLARIVLSKEGTRGFDEKTAKPVDLGKLKNARIFLDAHLYVERRTQRKFTAELYLEAFDINTKERIWVKNLSSSGGDARSEIPFSIPGPAVLPPKAVNITVKTIPVDADSEAISQEISGDVSGLLAARGYTMQGAAREPDVTLELRVRRDLFDKLGNWYVFSGRVRAKARLNGKSGRDLGQRSFDVKGTRGLTIGEAEKSLVKELSSQIDEWAAGVIDPGALNLMTEAVVLEFAEQVTEAEGQSNMEKFRRSVAGMPGCRTFEVKSRVVKNGIATVVFRAVYVKDLFPGGIMPGAFAEKPELANLLLAD